MAELREVVIIIKIVGNQESLNIPAFHVDSNKGAKGLLLIYYYYYYFLRRSRGKAVKKEKLAVLLKKNRGQRQTQ